MGLFFARKTSDHRPPPEQRLATLNMDDLLNSPDERTLKREYAKLLKVTRPDDDPAAFQRLRAAGLVPQSPPPGSGTHSSAIVLHAMACNAQPPFWRPAWRWAVFPAPSPRAPRY